MQGLTILFLALSSIATCLAKDRQYDFNNFKIKHKKQYKDAQEHDKRFKIFSENADLIDKHNEEAKTGKHSYTLKINKYADLATEEFAKLRGLKLHEPENTVQTNPNLRSKRASVPSSKDWRALGAVSDIRDQGFCGSCWAFSTVSVLESHSFIKTGKLPQLSEQNLVDCVGSTNYGCYGCNGGSPLGAATYVRDIGNQVSTQTSYPYTAADGTCTFNAAYNGLNATILNVTTVPALDEVSLKTVIGTIGPVMTAIDASGYDFQFYGQGVFSSTNCSNTVASLNHAVNLVGYGSNTQGAYWILRNSWSTSWGMNGYMYMARGKNMCGVAQRNRYPVLK